MSVRPSVRPSVCVCVCVCLCVSVCLCGTGANRQIRGEWWQYRDARDALPSSVRDTLLLSHTMSEEAIFELMFHEKLPPNEEVEGEGADEGTA